MLYEDMEIIEYSQAWEYQTKLFLETLNLKAQNKIKLNHFLLCEHPHTITLGKNADQNNLLFNKQFLHVRGVSLFQIDRGGDITYHGPGQIVGYPIFDLETFGIGLKQYIYNLEEVIIRLLDIYGIDASRLEGATGVWIDTDKPQLTRKIAAIGVRCSRYITMHGFALNVNTDLSYFDLINPCGFTDKGVTSMAKELGREIDTKEIKIRLKDLFEDIFKEL